MDLNTETASALITVALRHTYRDAGWADPSERLMVFKRERATDLYWLIVRYSGDPLVGPLPELAQLAPILERLEHDPTGLVANWPRELPGNWLDMLAELWGAPL